MKKKKFLVKKSKRNEGLFLRGPLVNNKPLARERMHRGVDTLTSLIHSIREHSNARPRAFVERER